MNTIKSFSYSSISDYIDCGFKYKLKYIEKIPSYKNTIDTIFGTIIHERVQSILLKKETTEESLYKFNRTWKTFYKMYRKSLDSDKIILLFDSGLSIIKNTEKAFSQYEAIVAEYEIKIPLEINKEQIFKGYIDLILKKKNSNNDEIFIVDLKTSSSAFMFKKFLTTLKSYQLVLYKHFYCLEKQLDPKLVSNKFIVLQKDPKAKKPIVFLDITSGNKKINNCLKILNSSIDSINKNKFLKNKGSCINDLSGIKCPFYGTEHCKNSHIC